MVWAFVPLPPPISYVEILTPNEMVLADGAFGRWVGHEGRALINEINTHIKETPESSLASCHHIGTQEGYEQEEAPHSIILAPWSWTFQPPELWEINFCYKLKKTKNKNPPNKSPQPDGITGEFSQTFKEYQSCSKSPRKKRKEKKKRKEHYQGNIPDEYRCKNPQQNISKPHSTIH